MNKNYNFKFNKKNGNQFTEKLDIYKQNPENNDMLIIIASLVFLMMHLKHSLLSLFQTFGINHQTFNYILKQGTVVLTFFLGNTPSSESKKSVIISLSK